MKLRKKISALVAATIIACGSILVAAPGASANRTDCSNGDRIFVLSSGVLDCFTNHTGDTGENVYLPNTGFVELGYADTGGIVVYYYPCSDYRRFCPTAQLYEEVIPYEAQNERVYYNQFGAYSGVNGVTVVAIHYMLYFT